MSDPRAAYAPVMDRRRWGQDSGSATNETGTRRPVTGHIEGREFGELPLVLTVPEAAEALRVSRGAGYELVRSGVLRSIRLGRTIRVPKSALVELLVVGDIGTGRGAGPRHRGPAHAEPLEELRRLSR
jgi:excisionase family DNA binding protein